MLVLELKTLFLGLSQLLLNHQDLLTKDSISTLLLIQILLDVRTCGNSFHRQCLRFSLVFLQVLYTLLQLFHFINGNLGVHFSS